MLECKNYSRLQLFFYFVQKLIVKQYKKTVQIIENDEKSVDEMSNILICFIDCLFYEQY